MTNDHDAHGGDAFDAKALFACVRALAEATLCLQTARDTLVVSTGNSMHGATIHILYATALALTNELGQAFAALRTSEHLETRAFVEDVLTQLHAPERVTVPPDDTAPTSEPPSS